ncbi:MAG: hypothetical protein Q9157_001710 [Trypethelium eluteriae]
MARSTCFEKLSALSNGNVVEILSDLSDEKSRQLLNNARRGRDTRQGQKECAKPDFSNSLMLRAEHPLGSPDGPQRRASPQTVTGPHGLSDRDFPDHVKYLWHNLNSEYSVTYDIWAAGVPSILFRNEAFDLAAIALSTQRLSIREKDPRYYSMSLTAYSSALQSHRGRLNSSPPSALLAVTSMLLALYEGAQPKGSHITYRGGHQGHFNGAIALMETCGPGPFQDPGYHEIFKKVRDVAVSPPKQFVELNYHPSSEETDTFQVQIAFSRREKTFLSSQAWRSVPWSTRPKTWRDQLFDIALDMTESVDENLLEERLRSWHKSWLGRCCHLDVVCSRACTKHCFCSLPPASFPNDQFSLLQAEFWAITLIFLTRKRDAVTKDVYNLRSLEVTELEDLNTACHRLALDLASALSLPCFGQNQFGVTNSRGISEGRSRAIVCSWALDVYRGGSHVPEEAWWAKLGKILNGTDSEEENSTRFTVAKLDPYSQTQKASTR